MRQKKGVSSILIQKFVMIVLTSLPPAGCSMLLRLQPGKHGRRSYEAVLMVQTYSAEVEEKEQQLEIAAQGVAQCKVSATRVVVDAALRRIG